MIEHLDNLLRHHLISEIQEIIDEAQVRFQPPDDSWRTYVASLTVQGQPANALNVYLFDVRENRRLRSNERGRQIENHTVSEIPVPRRIDCHYLISAWSPTLLTPAVEPTIDEHALLYRVAGVLINNESLIPREVYRPDPLPPNFPVEISDTELPTVIVPQEGFPKLAEFWGTVSWRWKPVVYLIVTLPVVLSGSVAGPMVTTRIAEFRAFGQTEIVDTSIQISGQILDGSNDQPLEDSWVRIEDAGGVPVATMTTGSDGRFVFSRLRRGTHTLRVRAEGHTEATQAIQVPSITGEYDVVLT